MKSADAVTLRSDGTSKWEVVNSGVRRPYTFWAHGSALAIPTGVWTPLPWNYVPTDEFGFSPALQGTATTIASGSNAAVLPQATINVASTTGFLSSGYIVITGAPGASTDTLVSYTGKTGTTFTGCNSAYHSAGVGVSTGTLATSQVVTQANVEFYPPTGYLWNTIACVAMASIPTTSYCSIRFRAIDGTFNFPIATADFAGINLASGQHIQVTLQPGYTSAAPSRIEVFHNAGSVKNSVLISIDAPVLMQAFMSSR